MSGKVKDYPWAEYGYLIHLLRCAIFEEIPVKKEVKATVSGLYITSVRGMRGPIEKPAQKKKGFRAKIQEKYDKASQELKNEKDAQAQKKSNKKKK